MAVATAQQGGFPRPWFEMRRWRWECSGNAGPVLSLLSAQQSGCGRLNAHSMPSAFFRVGRVRVDHGRHARCRVARGDTAREGGAACSPAASRRGGSSDTFVTQGGERLRVIFCSTTPSEQPLEMVAWARAPGTAAGGTAANGCEASCDRARCWRHARTDAKASCARPSAANGGEESYLECVCGLTRPQIAEASCEPFTAWSAQGMGRAAVLARVAPALFGVPWGWRCHGHRRVHRKLRGAHGAAASR
jgi:hypothetical protein